MMRGEGEGTMRGPVAMGMLVCRATRAILEQAGHEVTDAQDGLSAIERYFLDKPDLVLLDVTMRDMDGLEVLRRIRALDPQAELRPGDDRGGRRALARARPPRARQSWMDAMPIELDAAGTITQSSGPMAAISTSGPHAVRHCIQIDPASRSLTFAGVATSPSARTVIDSAHVPSCTTSKDDGSTATRSPTRHR